MDYVILSAKTVKDLRIQVMKLISEGYVPQGGLAISQNAFVYQAMIKAES